MDCRDTILQDSNYNCSEIKVYEKYNYEIYERQAFSNSRIMWLYFIKLYITSREFREKYSINCKPSSLWRSH